MSTATLHRIYPRPMSRERLQAANDNLTLKQRLELSLALLNAPEWS